LRTPIRYAKKNEVAEHGSEYELNCEKGFSDFYFYKYLGVMKLEEIESGIHIWAIGC